MTYGNEAVSTLGPLATWSVSSAVPGRCASSSPRSFTCRGLWWFHRLLQAGWHAFALLYPCRAASFGYARGGLTYGGMGAHASVYGRIQQRKNARRSIRGHLQFHQAPLGGCLGAAASQMGAPKPFIMQCYLCGCDFETYIHGGKDDWGICRECHEGERMTG